MAEIGAHLSLYGGILRLFNVYPYYFKLLGCWLRYEVRPWTSPLSGPPQAAFKSAPADLSLTPVT
ncbi:hypothetical protein C9426_16595 [Serratia sp. S1B]|nr:hypothetical protein C9426_16595 [Serratia sp. S1B]